MMDGLEMNPPVESPGNSPGEPEEHESSDEHCMIRMKKSKLPIVNPLPAVEERRSRSGLTGDMKMCEMKIRDAILHQRWEEAAHYMTSYPQMLEKTGFLGGPRDQETIWRYGIEILSHHPNTKMEDYTNIYERIKNTACKKYLMICLEHSFHLLVHGQVLEAKNQLSVAEGWRHGKISEKQDKTAKLISAYRSLLDYFMWCDKRCSHNLSDDIYYDERQEMDVYFRQASTTMKKLLRDPGVWDPFIVSYVDMLEYYGDYDAAARLLKNYAYDESFPPNPNALVYLYEFMRRHSAPENKSLRVLQTLHATVPSHELMLEYSLRLLQSEQHSDVPLAFKVVLEMLDFACWRSHVGLWNHLKDIIEKLQQEEGWNDVIQREMTPRKGWWPALHFTRFHARKDAEENPEIVEVKALLSKILCPDLKLSYGAAQGTGTT